MKLIFLSNYYSHHQKPVCEAWDQLTEHSFAFVSTEEMTRERRLLGWGHEAVPPFEISPQMPRAQQLPELIGAADCVIWGNAPASMVEQRLKQGGLVLKYAERVFKQGYQYSKWLPRLFTYWRNYGRYPSMYLLAASAYAGADYAMHGAFRGKSYKWGYFPETKHYDIERLLAEKQANRIVWCGRLLDWKHPEMAISVAAGLKAEGIPFHLDMIGIGPMQKAVEASIRQQGLQEQVSLLGAMQPEQVRACMEKAGIFLFTSDFREGWGAVVNEAMNSGCAVVASHGAGAVPYLVRHGENGLIFESGRTDGLYRKVRALLLQPRRQKQLGAAAYRTITQLWNGEVAARRLMALEAELREKGRCELYAEGPCSKAPVLKNHWFCEENYGISWIKDEMDAVLRQ